jgi:hypothetical protein
MMVRWRGAMDLIVLSPHLMADADKYPAKLPKIRSPETRREMNPVLALQLPISGKLQCTLKC